MTSRVLFVAVVIISACTSSALAQQDKATALCSDTLSALQKTDAAPLAKLLSAHAGTFLARVKDEPVLLNVALLADKQQWTDEPLFSDAAKLQEVKSSDRLYAAYIEAKIEDAGKNFLLDGAAVSEGGRLKWGTLAVFLQPAGEQAEETTRNEVLALMHSWMESLRGGDVNPLLESLAPEAFSLAVVGPDYGFYVFNERDDLKAVAQQAVGMGGLSMSLAHEPEVVVSGPLAVLHGLINFDVAGQTSSLECWAHLVRTPAGWRLASLFGLPPQQQ